MMQRYLVIYHIKHLLIIGAVLCSFIFPKTQNTNDYKLVWADEFNKDGAPDLLNWNYEKGFVRNEEDQWYQPENAYCKDGYLIIEAKREQKANPNYIDGGSDWRKNRSQINYTSSCLI